MQYTPAIQAYKSTEFLNSGAARNIRILCELEESKYRLDSHNIRATVLIFGSARAKSTDQFNLEMDKLLSREKNATTAEEKQKIKDEITVLSSKKWMSEYYDKVLAVGRKITQWAVDPSSSLGSGVVSGVARTKSMEALHNNKDVPSIPKTAQKVLICTGGGPGFMEAANKGAAEIPNAKNIGMGITLPFEDGLNPYVSNELAFQYHYFFTRKFWMVYNCQALIAAPGGVGTFDELFEVLTLKQTGKVQKDLPVVLFGKEFWQTVVNWDALVKYAVISEADVSKLYFTDDVDDAVNFITSSLSNPKRSI